MQNKIYTIEVTFYVQTINFRFVVLPKQSLSISTIYIYHIQFNSGKCTHKLTHSLAEHTFGMSMNIYYTLHFPRSASANEEKISKKEVKQERKGEKLKLSLGIICTVSLFTS